MTTPSAGKDIGKLDLSYIVHGNVKWYCHSGKNMAVSYKIKHVLTAQSSNCTPVHIYTKEMKTYTKNQHMDIHRSFIQNK